ncbi:MAG: hypothetical protein ACTHU0_25025 [Kofleriaceae bacterium]
MRRLLPLLVVCGLVSRASADGVYFTESVGATAIQDELGQTFDRAVRIRVGLGVRRGVWAAELWGGGFLDLQDGAGDYDRATGGYRDPSALGHYGLDLKYLQPMSCHVELYLRGSASAGKLGTEGALDGYGGRGLGGGGGIQLKGKVRALGFLWWPLFFTKLGPTVTAAIYADAGFDFYRLHPGGRLDATPAIDARFTTLSFGFSIGSDL